jgi:hypothetical protein
MRAKIVPQVDFHYNPRLAKNASSHSWRRHWISHIHWDIGMFKEPDPALYVAGLLAAPKLTAI